MADAIDIRRHPEYPFRPEREALLETRSDSFLDGPEIASPERTLLREFLHLAGCYAFLERLVQGEIRCDLPAHAGRILGREPGNPAEEGERLAAAEGGLLPWKAGSIESLADALDGIGLKTFEEASDSKPRSVLCGAFCFVAEIGPAIFAGAPSGAPEASFVLAHELGHLVADVDPYRSRFCRWDRSTLENRSDRREEIRADRFARALLVPSADFLRTLESLGPPPEVGPDLRVEQAATVFNVPPALVQRRLRDLGLPRAAADWTAPEASVPDRANREGEAEAAQVPLPERFVNLALAAYAGRAFDLEVLGRFLRTSKEEALRITEWVGVEQNAADDEG